MIDYRKLIPFKTICYTFENFKLLGKEIDKQELFGKVFEETFTPYRKVTKKCKFYVIFESTGYLYHSYYNNEYYDQTEVKEIPIERLLPAPKLKKFLQEFKKEKNE